MSIDTERRNQLARHLEGGLAFASLDNFLDNIPFEKIGVRPRGLPYSFYEVFFHIAFAQKDILEYATSEGYKTVSWPDDYWPGVPEPGSEDEWEDLKADFFEDRRILREFILDSENDLDGPVLNSDKHSLLRELMLVIEQSHWTACTHPAIIRCLR